jgi:subtilisin family serine protease
MLFVGAAAEVSDLQNGLLRREGIIPVASDDKHSTLESALYAPGREILTLLPDAHYDFASGASIATAQVSGVVALMLAKDPGLSAGAAYRVLRETSTPLSAGGIKSVDACAAVVRLVAQASCPSAGIERAALHEPRVALH